MPKNKVRHGLVVQNDPSKADLQHHTGGPCAPDDGGGGHPTVNAVIGKDRLAYSIANLSILADVGKSLIYKEIKDGNLSAIKLNTRTLIPADEAYRWLNSLPKMHSHE